MREEGRQCIRTLVSIAECNTILNFAEGSAIYRLCLEECHGQMVPVR